MNVDSARPFYWISGITILILSAIVFYSQYQRIADEKSITVFTIAGTAKIKVEIAKTPEKLARGLMNRKSLSENSGMLFVFQREELQSFWMKDTLIPLDLIFISPTGRVSETTTLHPCETKNCPTYYSKSPAQYVLEVNAGFSEKRKITEGDLVKFPDRF